MLCPVCNRYRKYQVLSLASDEADTLCLLCEAEGICLSCSEKMHR